MIEARVFGKIAHCKHCEEVCKVEKPDCLAKKIEGTEGVAAR